MNATILEIKMIGTITTNPIGITIAVFFLLLFFLGLRKLRKNSKEFEEFIQTQKNLKVGDTIVTTSGIIGKISKIRGDALEIQSGNLVFEVIRSTATIHKE